MYISVLPEAFRIDLMALLFIYKVLHDLAASYISNYFFKL